MSKDLFHCRTDIMESTIGMTPADKLILSQMLNINYATGGTCEQSFEYFSRKFGLDYDTARKSVEHLYEGGALADFKFMGFNREGETVYRYIFNPCLNTTFPGCLDTLKKD